MATALWITSHTEIIITNHWWLTKYMPPNSWISSLTIAYIPTETNRRQPNAQNYFDCSRTDIMKNQSEWHTIICLLKAIAYNVLIVQIQQDSGKLWCVNRCSSWGNRKAASINPISKSWRECASFCWSLSPHKSKCCSQFPQVKYVINRCYLFIVLNNIPFDQDTMLQMMISSSLGGFKAMTCFRHRTSWQSVKERTLIAALPNYPVINLKVINSRK